MYSTGIIFYERSNIDFVVTLNKSFSFFLSLISYLSIWDNIRLHKKLIDINSNSVL